MVSPSRIESWLAMAREGDDAARNKLLAATRSFMGIVAGMQARRALQAKFDPSDIVQQSLLEVHQGFEDFAGHSPQEWMGWVKQIVVRNSRDADRQYINAERRDVSRELPMAESESGSRPGHTPIDPGPTASRIAMACEDQLRLAEAIQQLPDEYQQVVILRNVERLPFDQVAQTMQRSRGACQMLWMRAIEQLQRVMTESHA